MKNILETQRNAATEQGLHRLVGILVNQEIMFTSALGYLPYLIPSFSIEVTTLQQKLYMIFSICQNMEAKVSHYVKQCVICKISKISTTKNMISLLKQIYSMTHEK
jgi:hypothetical protein